MWRRTVRHDICAGECSTVYRRFADALPSLTPIFPSSSSHTLTTTGALGILRKGTGPSLASTATPAPADATGLIAWATHLRASKPLALQAP
jgi:hypothetical protein